MCKKIDPKAIKAIAIDLDGTTLLPNAILGERTRICFKKLLIRGMQIIISTGRAIESSERYLSAIGAQGPMIFFNGAQITDYPGGKILYTNLIGLDVVNYGIEIAREMNVHYQVYLPAGISPETGKQDPNQRWEPLMVDKDGPEVEQYYRHTGIIPLVKDLKSISQMELKGCIKGMYIADPSKHDEIRSRMTDRFGESISITRSFPTFLEVLNKGVSKGEGLKIAMAHSGLNPEEVIAFGDEENDLSMFKTAGFCAAPASARVQIRDQADLIYGPIEEEGLAEYLERTFL